MKTIKQPEITQKELNKTARYFADVEKNGYQPWNTIRQSHTYGQGQEVLSRLSDRTHHLYGRGERQMFVLIESLPNVIDLKEQLPLPIDETLALAEELNILHPGSYKERVEHNGIIPAKTMTSDLVATFRDANQDDNNVVYSFKYADALDEKKHPRSAKRTKQKLALERLYWERQGIQWVLITEKSFSPVYIYNLEYLRECFLFPELLEVGKDINHLFIRSLYQAVDATPSMTLKECLEVVALKLEMSTHQAQALFQQAAYFKKLKVDMYEAIELYRPLKLLNKEREYAC